jgi:hypothetical protein
MYAYIIYTQQAYMYNVTYTYIIICAHTHPHWKPLHHVHGLATGLLNKITTLAAILNQTNPAYIPPPPAPFKYISLQSPPLCTDHQSGIFRSGFTTSAFLLATMHTTCPAHLTTPSFDHNIYQGIHIYGAPYYAISSSLWSLPCLTKCGKKY